MTQAVESKITVQDIPVPETVKQAGVKANEMIEELNKPAGDVDIKPEDQDSKPVTGEDKPGENLETAPPEKKAPEKKEPVTDWKQKYSVLQGKYNAEIPRLNTQVHGQANEIARLNDEVNTLKAAGNVKPKPVDGEQKPDDTNLGDDINPEDYDDYPPEIVNLAKKNKKLEAKLENLSKSVGSAEENRTKTEEDQKRVLGEGFYKKMVDWDDVNDDPKFLDWLKNDIHPSYGVSRYPGFAKAVNAFDSDKVITIFKEFKALTPDIPNDPAPKKKEVVIKNVQPPKGAAETTIMADADGAKLWTPASMKKHYDEKIKGVWKGREPEWKKLEIDLLSAQGQGRVRPD